MKAKKPIISVTIEEAMLARIDQIADRARKSRSEVVGYLLRDAMAAKPTAPRSHTEARA
jgi:metal-responsive CopG/Arc/MetJ family transcriptional regulator